MGSSGPRTLAGPPSPPPLGSAAPPGGWPRSKAVRLARLSPELMGRLAEDNSASKHCRNGRPESVSSFLPNEQEVPPKLSFSMPLPRAPWDRSSLGPPSPAGRASVPRGAMRRSDPINAAGCESLLQSTGLHLLQHPLLGASGGSVQLQDTGEVTFDHYLARSTGSREGHLREIESLQRRCAQLSEAIRLGRAATFPSVRCFCARVLHGEERLVGLVVLRAWRAAVSDELRHMAAVRADEAREALRALSAEATTQRAAAAARLVEVRAEADARIAGLEARLHDEASRRASAEASQRAALEAEAARAQALRARALVRGAALARFKERQLQVAVCRAWGAQAALASEALRRKAAEAEAEAASERAAAAEARILQLEGSFSCLPRGDASSDLASDGDGATRVGSGGGGVGGGASGSDSSLLLLGGAGVGGAATVALAAASGSKPALLAAACRASLHAVVAAWRTAVCTRHSVGLLQAKLFAEEAHRSAALTKQRRQMDARFIEEEARHREAVERLRAEVAGSEARHAEVLASQDAESAQRLAAAEADFSRALQQAVGTPAPADHGGGEGGSHASDHEASAGGQVQADVRVASAVRSMRASADARLVEVEARQAEALQHERERAARMLAEAERQHLEAFRRVQQEAERRVAEAEDRQLQVLGELQQANDERLRDLEGRHARTLLALQGSLVDDITFDDSPVSNFLGPTGAESDYYGSPANSDSGEVYGDTTPRLF